MKCLIWSFSCWTISFVLLFISWCSKCLADLWQVQTAGKPVCMCIKCLALWVSKCTTWHSKMCKFLIKSITESAFKLCIDSNPDSPALPATWIMTMQHATICKTSTGQLQFLLGLQRFLQILALTVLWTTKDKPSKFLTYVVLLQVFRKSMVILKKVLLSPVL